MYCGNILPPTSYSGTVPTSVSITDG